LYDDIDIYTGFPTEFKINLKDLNNTNIRFIKIAKDDNHPIVSDDIYTVDSDHKATKVNIPNTHNEVKIKFIYKNVFLFFFELCCLINKNKLKFIEKINSKNNI
jgi:hypothetical protein